MITANLENDPGSIGYTPFSNYRVGNLVWVPTSYKGFGYALIGEVISRDVNGDPGLFEIKDLENGRTATGRVGITEGFSSRRISPEQLGFERPDRMSKSWYRNGIILVDITNIASYSNSEAFQPNDRSYVWPEQLDTISDIGYELYVGERQIFKSSSFIWEHDEVATNTGLMHVHELQNIYADLLPNESLDIENYVNEAINYQVRSREIADRRV